MPILQTRRRRLLRDLLRRWIGAAIMLSVFAVWALFFVVLLAGCGGDVQTQAVPDVRPAPLLHQQPEPRRGHPH